MKICSKCKCEKDDSEYWVRKNRKSGLNSECKNCCSLRRRLKDKELVNKQQREWVSRNREKSRESSLRYQKENAEKVNATHRKWYSENKDRLANQRKEQSERINIWNRAYAKKEHVRVKKAACSMLLRNVKNGSIVKPKNCQVCGKENKLEGHHFDYSKPLIVIWVCKRCHVDIHQVLKKRKNAVKPLI